MAQQRAKGSAAPPKEGAQVTPAAFDGIEDVDVVAEGGQIRVILSEKVFFTPGSAVINDRGKTILKKVAGVLNRSYGGAAIRVDGHTDSTPITKTKDKYASNWELSTTRACAVTRFLIEAGVVPERIFAAGFAYHRPVASNATEAGRQKNRRVEIVILRS